MNGFGKLRSLKTSMPCALAVKCCLECFAKSQTASWELNINFVIQLACFLSNRAPNEFVPYADENEYHLLSFMISG